MASRLSIKLTKKKKFSKSQRLPYLLCKGTVWSHFLFFVGVKALWMESFWKLKVDTVPWHCKRGVLYGVFTMQRHCMQHFLFFRMRASRSYCPRSRSTFWKVRGLGPLVQRGTIESTSQNVPKNSLYIEDVWRRTKSQWPRAFSIERPAREYKEAH